MSDAPRVAMLGRRGLLKALGAAAVATGAGGFALAVHLRERRRVTPPSREQPFAPNAFVAIDEAGLVTLWCSRSEMGQGVLTALPMIVAEELDADFRAVRVVQAEAHAGYGDQATVASSSVVSLFDGLALAGAAARAMLVRAAAQHWGVPEETCRTALGQVHHDASGRSATYGELATLAATLEVPTLPPRKPASARTLVGTPQPRLDTPAKVDGSAVFGADVRLPGMLYAAVVRPPSPDARFVRAETRAARAVPGVVDVQELDVAEVGRTVAVLARSTWAAFRGRDALDVRWDVPRPAYGSTAEVMDALRALAGRPGVVAEERGDAPGRIAGAARHVEATYEVPLAAHVPMEPLVATAHVERDRCTLWVPTQHPLLCQRETATMLGLRPEDVHVNVTFLGGGFGRRAERQEVREAVALSRATGRPVRVQWSREDELRSDWYRPPAVVRWTAGLDERGELVGVQARIASPGLTGVDGADGRLDPLACDGATASVYAWPASRVEWRGITLPVRVGIWRSVGHSYNAFALECFVDEVAHAMGRDPLALRRALLAPGSRARTVLERAVERAGVAPDRDAGVGRGLAVHGCFGSFVAMVADVERSAERVRVRRIVAAVDCGQVVNPNVVRQQIEGGIAFGLSATLHGGIELAQGRVVQSNFHDHPILRIDEMPEVVVEIVASDEAPGGVGELGVPTVAPAVVNALATLGERTRALPVRMNG